MNSKFVVLTSVVLLAGGCAITPMGPTVQVMPSPNKPFEMFMQDQELCKQYASQQVAGQAEVANTQAVGGAILGTALGTGLGAAIGGRQGAGIGAASGAIVGSSAGTGYSQGAQLTIQQQYDVAYQQCMYSKGNQVPGFQPGYGGPPPSYGGTGYGASPPNYGGPGYSTPPSRYGTPPPR